MINWNTPIASRVRRDGSTAQLIRPGTLHIRKSVSAAELHAFLGYVACDSPSHRLQPIVNEISSVQCHRNGQITPGKPFQTYCNRFTDTFTVQLHTITKTRFDTFAEMLALGTSVGPPATADIVADPHRKRLERVPLTLVCKQVRSPYMIKPFLECVRPFDSGAFTGIHTDSAASRLTAFRQNRTPTDTRLSYSYRDVHRIFRRRIRSDVFPDDRHHSVAMDRSPRRTSSSLQEIKISTVGPSVMRHDLGQDRALGDHRCRSNETQQIDLRHTRGGSSGRG
jgi:hypothetical protein